MPQSEFQCRVRTIDHLVLTVASIPVSVRFYTQVLGMRGSQFKAADGTTRWALVFGHNKINLHQRGQEYEPKAAHAHPGTADICFLTDAPLEEWIIHLDTHQVDVAQGPVERTGATGAILSLYVRDPDKNLIEISVPAD